MQSSRAAELQSCRAAEHSQLLHNKKQAKSKKPTPVSALLHAANKIFLFFKQLLNFIILYFVYYLQSVLYYYISMFFLIENNLIFVPSFTA
jgi:hypothetical protein